MRTVALPGGRRVSVLGLGTAGLGRRLTRRQKLRLLEHAFDLGITYFDTAPLYGRGQAEGVLGAFAAGKRDRVAIATKIGMAWTGRVRRRVVRSFEPAAARRRLQASLRELRTDRIDLLLVHEPRETELGEELVEFLHDTVAQGLAGAVGVAGGPLLPALVERAEAFPRVVQAAVEELAPLSVPESRFVISHSAIAPVLGRVATVAERAGVSAGELPALCVRRALRLNPRGLVLFGTADPRHLRADVDASASADDEAVDRLEQALQTL